MKLCGAAEAFSIGVAQINGDKFKTVDELGGDLRRYQNGHRGVLFNFVGEIYSRPRATSAINFLVDLGLLLGFAFDLTTTKRQ